MFTGLDDGGYPPDVALAERINALNGGILEIQAGTYHSIANGLTAALFIISFATPGPEDILLAINGIRYTRLAGVWYRIVPGGSKVRLDEDEITFVIGALSKAIKVTLKKGGTSRKINITNQKRLAQLRTILPGKWWKRYADGWDEQGKKISVHYFEHKSGFIFGEKCIKGWSNQ